MMNLKNSLKHMLFCCPPLMKDVFYQIYNVVKYPNMTEKRFYGGNLNKNRTIYVIRPRTDGVEGLMALLLNVIKQISYAEKRGYTPFVDFQNYQTQYSDSELEEKNAWEYYFKQVSDLTIEDVYQSSNVRLSGLNALKKADTALDQKFDRASMEAARTLVQKYIHFSDAVIEKVLSEEKQFDVTKSIGLYLRGTDYVKLRPAGHQVQPTAEQAIEKTDELMRKYGIVDVFLVTEDADIYNFIKQYYGDKLHIVSYDSFVSGYSGKTFLSQDSAMINQLSDSPYVRGLNYLCKLIILSRCKYFVGGNTCGSWAACAFSEGFIEQYIFELGTY